MKGKLIAVLGDGSGPVLGRLFMDRYWIEEELGDDGSGARFVAFDDVRKHTVWLQLHARDGSLETGWSPARRDALERLRSVEHPKLARLYDFGEHPRGCYSTMEIPPGRSVAERLSEQPSMDAELGLDVVAGVCEGLAALHEHGLVVRTITPRHVWVEDGGRVMLGGFDWVGVPSADGLADTEVLDSSEDEQEYLAPELLDGGPIGTATDLFSVGALLRRLLTGGPPDAANPSELRLPPSVEARVSETVVSIMARCLAEAPGRRPESAAAVARVLRDAREHSPTSMPTVVEHQPTGDEPEPSMEARAGRSDEPEPEPVLEPAEAPSLSGGGDGSPRSVDPRTRLYSDPESSDSGSSALEQRFTSRGVLGEGAMGKVIQAFDEVRRHEVALKILKRVNPGGLYDFKQEFRLLSGLVHPNIVTLYELFSEQGQWAVSMGLIDGARPMLDYVRPYSQLLRDSGPRSSRGGDDASQQRRETGGADVVGADDPDATRSIVGSIPRPPPTDPASERHGISTSVSGVSSSDSLRAPSLPGGARFSRRMAVMAARLDLERMRDAMLQLVDGIDFVHQRGLLHRDLKPSNVLVDGDGRVVVCDFGLVVAAGSGQRDISGTPAYMSPEQARNGPLTPASDFYSVGVMLYEALTGQLPITGPSAALLIERKSWIEISPPQDLDPEVDSELASLAMELLRDDPRQRPGPDAIRAVLRGVGASGSRRSSSSSSSSWKRRADSELFIGRHRERSWLNQILGQSRRGTVTVLVSGPSGVGKSTLVRVACQGMRDEHDALVLTGRCYQSESVPFKAVDSIVDALTDHLESLDSSRVRALVPDDIEALCVLFPVLRRIRAISKLTKERAVEIPTHLLQGRAQEAFGQLLLGLAAERPLVIVIDDLQWGDLDSAPFLRELVEARATAGVLLVATVRNDAGSREGDGAQLVELLSQEPSGGADASRVHVMELGPLDQNDVVDLVSAIAGHEARAQGGVNQVLADAGGNPMFVAELAHSIASGESVSGEGGLELDALLERRIHGLPAESQRLLAAAAIVASPQPMSVLRRALEIDNEAAALTQLVAARLLNTVPRRDQELVTTYHDRVREVAIRTLLSPDERRQLHRTLALAFEDNPEPDLESLAVHWAGAGDDDKAGSYSLKAAERAVEVHAFRRAADSFERALALGVVGDEDLARVQLARADALFFAGRMREAARVYGEAVPRLDSVTTVRALSQQMVSLLFGGDTKGASELSRVVGQTIGVTIPQSKLATLGSIIWSRLSVKLKPPKILRLQPPESTSEEQRTLLDSLFNMVVGLQSSGDQAYVTVHTRYLRSSLAVGDPRHVARALSYEATLHVHLSPRGIADPRVATMLAEARRAAEATGSDAHVALVEGSHGGCGYLGMSALRDSARRLDEAAPRVERDLAFSSAAHHFRNLAVSAYALAGSYGVLSRRFPKFLQRAEDTGNEFLRDLLTLHCGIHLYLAQAQPRRARDLLGYKQPREHDAYSSQYWWSELRRAEIEAYEGAWVDAAHRLARLFEIYKGRPQLSVAVAAGRAWATLGLCSTVASTRNPHERAFHLDLATKAVAKITRYRTQFPAWSAGMSGYLRALRAAVEGDRDSMLEHAREAVPHFDELQSARIATPLRHEIGTLLGGDEGASLVQEARELMDREGIIDHEAFVHWTCPLSLCLESSR